MNLSNRVPLTHAITGIGLEAAKLFRPEDATIIIVQQNSVLQPIANQTDERVSALRLAAMPTWTPRFALRYRRSPRIQFDAPREVLPACWHSALTFGDGRLYLIQDGRR